MTLGESPRHEGFPAESLEAITGNVRHEVKLGLQRHALPLTRYVILGKVIHLSKPQFYDL